MPYLYVGNLPANVSAREVRALLDNVCEHGSIGIKKTGRTSLDARLLCGQSRCGGGNVGGQRHRILRSLRACGAGAAVSGQGEVAITLPLTLRLALALAPASASSPGRWCREDVGQVQTVGLVLRRGVPRSIRGRR